MTQDAITVLYEIISTFVAFFLHQIEQSYRVCDVDWQGDEKSADDHTTNQVKVDDRSLNKA